MTDRALKIGDRITVHDSSGDIVDRGKITELLTGDLARIRSDAGDTVVFGCEHLQFETV